jgi:hypothetical protein
LYVSGNDRQDLITKKALQTTSKAMENKVAYKSRGAMIYHEVKTSFKLTLSIVLAKRRP